jgi:serine/threonine-protein kinase
MLGSSMTETAPAGLEIGALFHGRYRVVRRIKTGGMGAVYQVVHVETRRHRALKVMLPSLVADADMRVRFEREATVAADIKSEHIVETFDAGVDPQTGLPFLVMELLEGQELGQLLKTHGRLPPDEVVTLLGQAALALDKTHAAGIVHRDLKPDNLFLTHRDDGSPRLKILDFGIAKVVAPGDDPTYTQTLGTPLYIPREQLRGDGKIGPAADRYALGQIAYALLVGEPYWLEDKLALDSAFALMLMICDGPKERASKRAARSGVELPRAFDAWFARASAVGAADRWPSAADLVVELAKALGEPVPAALAPPGPSDEATPLSRRGSLPSVSAVAPRRRRAAPARVRGRIIALAVLPVALVAAAGAGVFALRSRSPAPPPPSSAAPAQPPGCRENRECLAAGARGPAICRKDDGACVPLASEDCQVLAEPGDLQSDATVWFGAMFPRSGVEAGTFGEASVRAVDLARRDFNEISGGLPPALPGGPKRPLAVVVCDDASNATRAAEHLVNDVRVPAIVGFARSKEVVDLASSLFIPKGVLALASNQASMLSSIPHAPGHPRLVWRTTTSAGMVVAPITALLTELIEPNLRQTPGLLMPRAPIRVALARVNNTSGQSYADLYVGKLRYNGKSVPENGDSFRVVPVPDASSEEELKRVSERAGAEIAAYQPHVVLCAASDALLVVAVERAWPARLPFRPHYLVGNMIPEPLLALAREKPELRRRILSVDAVAGNVPTTKFVTRYNEVFSPKVTQETATDAPYDAFYVAAYAAAALGEQPITGPGLGKAIARLLPPGEPIDVGPGGIYPALHALGSGKNIDLAGTMTTLDFNPETGDATTDFAVYCAGPGKPGGGWEAVASGLVFRARTGKLEGKMRCP